MGHGLRRSLALLALLVAFPTLSAAQNPQFTACTASTADGTLTLTGQVAGLGNQRGTPLRLEATALAVWLDPTTTPPTVVTATTVTDSLTYPPKNGNRVYHFVLDTPFVLVCDPPGEVTFVAARTCDVTHGVCCAELVEPAPAPGPAPE
jgi:hypothetical protein